MKLLLVRFARDESGATAIEYGLIVGLIASLIIIGVQTIGGQLSRIFGDIARVLGGVSA